MAGATAAYLQVLVRRIMGDNRAPVAIRNACHRLILAINTNNLAQITECLEQLQLAAAAEGYPLPTLRAID